MLPGEEDGANFSDMEKRAGFTMKLKSAISQLRRAFVDDSNDANVQIIQQLAKKAKVGCYLVVLFLLSLHISSMLRSKCSYSLIPISIYLTHCTAWRYIQE